jgi:hypothetical protein
MRRILILALLAAFGLPAVAPALTLGQVTENSLPACCRRNGVHHCMGNMQRPANAAPAFTERCPSFPQPSTTPSQTSGATPLLIQQSIAFEFAAMDAAYQADTQRRISRSRSHHKRGPPTVLLA